MTENYRISDLMTCALANLLQDEEIVFHGVASHMPMVAAELAKAKHAKNLVHLNITGGVNPTSTKESNYSSVGHDLFETGEAYFSLENIFDLSMRGKLDVAFLSGVQFDKDGNVNASVIGDYHKPKVRLPGGAGSAVLIPTAKKAIIWRTKHDIRTFVDQVDFVTTRGNVWRIVTPLCVFKFEDGQLKLDSIHPHTSLEEVQANTAFDLVYDEVKYTALPTEQERTLLEEIDPDDYRSIEF